MLKNQSPFDMVGLTIAVGQTCSTRLKFPCNRLVLQVGMSRCSSESCPVGNQFGLAKWNIASNIGRDI
jgi:hypothetical protein